jgi:hypothetical protein
MAVPIGYYSPDPRALAGGQDPSAGLLQQLAARMSQGAVPEGVNASQMPQVQGLGTQQAYRMAGLPPLPVQSARKMPFAPLSIFDMPGGLSGAAAPAGSAAAAPNNRFSGAASGAAAGAQLGGWPGAIVGGVVGYGANGGVKDANPIDASGFSGKTMDEAWASQDLARLASNPASSLASKFGVSSDSALGKVLDPAGFLHHTSSKKRNWQAFDAAYPGTTVNDEGNYVLPDGKVINQKQLDDLTGTWYGATYAPDGDQAGWQKKFQDVLASLYGG